MKNCNYDHFVLLGKIEYAIWKSTNNNSSDIFVYKRIGFRITRYPLNCFFQTEDEFFSQTLPLSFIPMI